MLILLKSEAFQEDIYPDTLSGEPSLAADDWFSGVDAPLRLLKMESVYQTGSSSQPSRQREFTPANQSQPEPKSIPKVESKSPVQSNSTSKIASTAIPTEKPISSILRTPSELKKPSTPDLKKDRQLQQPEEPGLQPISKEIEKATKNDGPAIGTESNLPSGAGPTVNHTSIERTNIFVRRLTLSPRSNPFPLTQQFNDSSTLWKFSLRRLKTNRRESSCWKISKLSTLKL